MYVETHSEIMGASSFCQQHLVTGGLDDVSSLPFSLSGFGVTYTTQMTQLKNHKYEFKRG